MVEPKKCLDAIETLIKNGADTTIRCNRGYLPIDLFKTLSLRLDEFDVDRGECLLGADKTESYIRKEKWYLTAMIFIFFAVYISLSFFIVGKKSTQSDLFSGNYDEIYFLWNFYFQMFYVIFLNRLCPYTFFHREALFFVGIETKPIRSKLCSEIKFFRNLENIGIVFLILRTLCLQFKNIYSTHIFFHTYLVIVCIYFISMFIPDPCRQQLHKYHSIYMFAFRVVLTCVLGLWILYLLLFYQNETVSIFAVENINCSDLVLFIIAKLLMFFVNRYVFIPHLIRPLLIIKFQPIFFHRQDELNFISMSELLFYIAELLLVSLTMILSKHFN